MRTAATLATNVASVQLAANRNRPLKYSECGRRGPHTRLETRLAANIPSSGGTHLACELVERSSTA
jgi:hypothetical protein